MAFRTALTIRFGDIDLAGIVYYPRYLHFCHVAMEEFFREAVGLDYPRLLGEHRLGFPTVHIDVSYHQPLRYGDQAEIEARIERLGSSSLVWEYTIYRQGEAHAVFRARLVTVAVDMQSFEKRPIPPWLRDRFVTRGLVAAEGGSGPPAAAAPQGHSTAGIS